MYLKFSRLLLIGLALIAAPLPLAAQVYRVYRPLPKTEQPQRQTDTTAWAEIQVSAAALYGPVRDGNGGALFHWLSGGGATAWVYLTNSVAIGAQGYMLQAADMQTAAVSVFKHQSYGAIAKWIVTPQTTPQLYVLGGLGYMREETKFKKTPGTLRTSGEVISAGLGIQARVWRGWYLNGEWQLQAQRYPWDNFAFRASRWRQQFSIAAGYRF